MKTVCIGSVGCGFVSHIHAEAYKRVRGIQVRLKAVTGTDMAENKAFAEKFGYEKIYGTYEELLKDPEIDVVDICVPNLLHSKFIIMAAQAKKHVICEKPMLGFFDEYGEGESKEDYAARALQFINEEIAEIRKAVEENHVKLMYAENWVYASPVTKATEMIAASKGSIMDIRAEESHSGSHAAYTRKLTSSGGGAMLSLGAHPFGAAIYLKTFEGQLKNGEKIGVRSVTASMAQFNKEPVGSGEEKTYVVNDWVDVENWSTAILTFTDGSKAVVTDSFAMLGGVRNTMEIYLNNCVIKCNITPNNMMNVYAPDRGIFDGVYLQEKLETNVGWHDINADEDLTRGYPQEMQEFMECVAFDRKPISDLDFAADTIRAIYAGYLSAASGRTVEL